MTRFHHLIFVLCLFLGACGGGGGGGSNNEAGANQNNSAQPKIALASAQAAPFDAVSISVENPAPTGSHEAELDLGNGIVVEIPLIETSPGTFEMTAPPGVLDSQKKFTNGTVIVRLKRTLNGNVSYSDGKALEILSMPTAPNELGKATLALLEANKFLALDSIGNLGVLQAKASSGLSINAAAASANQAIAEINKMIEAVNQVKSGGVVTIGEVKGQSILLNQASLAEMDRFSLAILSSIAKISKPKAQANGLASFESPPFSLDDPRSIATSMADKAREVATRVGQNSSLLLGVVGAAALVLGAPEIAVAAGVIGAVSFMTTTLAGTSIGAILDGGSAAIIDGKASLDDFKESTEFFGNQYLDYAQGYIVEKGLTNVFGDLGGSVINTGAEALKSYEQFTNEQILPAYDNGTLSPQGYPQSGFTLSVSASAQPYIVTVQTLPTVSSANIRVQISGTDGYVYNSDTIATNGVATFYPQPAASGSGIVDTVNAFDIDGRALASTQVTF